MNKGFTLIETIVAIAIFGIVVAIAIGALVGLLGASSVIRATQTGTQNLDAALDQMSREIGFGTLYYCDSSPSFSHTSPSADCEVDGNSVLSFVNQDGEYVAYRYNSTDKTIERNENDTEFVSTISSEVRVDDLKFRVFGNQDDNIIPKVLISAKGEVDVPQDQPSEFSVQLTVAEQPTKEPVLARKSQADDVCQLEPAEGRTIVRFFGGEHDTSHSNAETLTLGRIKPDGRWDYGALQDPVTGDVIQDPDTATELRPDRLGPCTVDFQRSIYNFDTNNNFPGLIPGDPNNPNNPHPNIGINASYHPSRCLTIKYDISPSIPAGEYDILLSTFGQLNTPSLNEWDGTYPDPHETIYMEFLDASGNTISFQREDSSFSEYTNQTKSLLDYRFYNVQTYWSFNRNFRILKPATRVENNAKFNDSIASIVVHFEDPDVLYEGEITPPDLDKNSSDADGLSTVGTTPLCAAFDSVEFEKVKTREF